MEQTPKLKRALNELRRITGITLDVNLSAEDDIEAVLNQIHCLGAAYKEKYNKTDFLRSLLTGKLPVCDLSDRAARLHIQAEELRVLFLLETKTSYEETVLEILKNLFPSQSKTYLVPINAQSIAVIKPVKSEDISAKDCTRSARMIVDTLNTEALAHVRVSFSSLIRTLSDLPGAYEETCLALKVGKLFFSEQTVFPYNELGVGRLIYQLPVRLCESFLREIFGNEIPHTFDEDTAVTINKFFQNNLNIAETSRQLHMHRNTLIYRLDQVEKRTGLDIRKFEDAMTYKIAMMVINYLQTERNL